MSAELAQFKSQELGPEYRHAHDLITVAPPPGGYVVKASKNGETAPEYDPYGGPMRIVVNPHTADSFEFNISRNGKKQEELSAMVHTNAVKQSPNEHQRENVVSTLKEFAKANEKPKETSQQKVFTSPAVNNTVQAPVEEKEPVLPLVETTLTFVGSPFRTDACFNDVFEDDTKKWLFLVYYNSPKNRVSRTSINATDMLLELKIKGRDIGYKLDVKEPIVVDFDKFSFVILKIVDAVVV